MQLDQNGACVPYCAYCNNYHTAKNKGIFVARSDNACDDHRHRPHPSTRLLASSKKFKNLYLATNNAIVPGSPGSCQATYL